MRSASRSGDEPGQPRYTTIRDSTRRDHRARRGLRHPVGNKLACLVAGGASSSVYDALNEILALRRSSTT